MQFPTSRRVRSAAATAGLFLAVAAIGSSASSASAKVPSTPADGTGTFTLATGYGIPPSFNVITVDSSAAAALLGNNVLQTVIQVNPQTYAIEPDLATSWTISKNRLTYKFNLNKTARFSDGNPVTAADVVADFKLEAAKASAEAVNWTSVKTIKTSGRYQVTLELSARDDMLLYDLGTRAAYIFDPAHYATLGTDPIGSGPFEFQKYTPDASVVLVRNPRWTGPKPALHKITWIYPASATAAVTGLEDGQYDAIDILSDAAAAPQLKADGWTIQPDPTPRIYGLYFNVKDAPFNNLRVRQAIADAINPKAFVSSVGAGFGHVVGSWITLSDPWYIKINDHPYDPTEAKKLLSEAGYPNGFSFTIKVAAPSDPNATLVALELAQIGITVNIDPEAATQDIVDFEDGNFQAITEASALFGQIADFANGDGYVTGWNSAAFDKAIKAAEAAPTTKKEYADYDDAAKIMATDVPMVALWNGTNLTVLRPGIKGWVKNRIDQSVNLTGVSWSASK